MLVTGHRLSRAIVDNRVLRALGNCTGWAGGLLARVWRIAEDGTRRKKDGATSCPTAPPRTVAAPAAGSCPLPPVQAAAFSFHLGTSPAPTVNQEHRMRPQRGAR
jgi:hypothetical protein